VVVTARLVVDLAYCAPEDQRHELDRICLVPDGGQVTVLVGRMRPVPDLVRQLRPHRNRLDMILDGAEPRLVVPWLDAIATNMIAGFEL
jgi:hypothetical protein